MAQVLLKRKKHFAKVGLIKACLKIVANLQQGGKCTVDKAEQMLLSNKEHSIFCLHCHIGCMHSQGWIEMQQSMAGVDETEKV